MFARDKQHHMVYTLAIALAVAQLWGPAAGLIVAALVGVLKELVWDWWLGRGHPDWQDALANVAGLVAAGLLLR